MGVIEGARALPIDIYQYIQDKDPSIPLHLVCKGVRPKLFRYGYMALYGKKLRGKRGAVAFAYSSGDYDHLCGCIIQTKRKINHSKLNCEQYHTRMEEFKRVMWVRSGLHYRLLN